MQLLDARKQAPIDITEDLLVQDPGMVLSEIRPDANSDEEESIENDNKYIKLKRFLNLKY